MAKKNKNTGEKSDHNGVSMNLLKPVCIAGAKAKAEGKKKSDNPYSEISQAYRRWERGFDNSDAISRKLNPEPVAETADVEAPKKKRAPRKKKVEVAEA